MTDHDDVHTTERLGTLLHDRVRDVQPDLAALASAAIRVGTRARRRRRLTAASTTLAGVAAAGAIGVQLWPTAAPGPGTFAAAPSPRLSPSTSPSPSATASPADCPSGLRRANLHGGTANATPSKTAPGSIGPARVTKSDQAQSPCSGQTPEAQHLPVTFNAPGWTCDTPADDKFACRDGANTVLVTLRPAQFHADYLSDPDKASPTQFVSDVHDGSFATIELVSGNVSVDQLSEFLVWN